MGVNEANRQPSAFTQTEVGLIPDDWSVSSIGAEFSIQLGKMLDAEKNIGAPKPFIGNRSIRWGRIDISNLGLINLTTNDLQRYRLQEGDLLVCEGGEVGRSAIWNHPIEECYFQKALHRLRAKRRFNVVLLQKLLQRYSQSGFLKNYVTQTSIAHLPKDKFETIPIPVPASEMEQQAIATALSDADALIESLEQLLAKKRQIKQGAMQELLTGKRRLPGFEGEWEVKRIGEFSECTAGGTPSTKVPEYWGGAIRWMSSGELNLKIVNEVEGRITEKGLISSSTKLLPSHCVLIGLAGQGKTRGTAAMNAVPLCTNQSIAAIFPNEYFCSRFLYYNVDNRYEELRELSAGDGGRGGLNLTIIRSLEILFPDLVEQTAIATALSDMDTEITALEAKLTKTRQIKQGMMQALLTGRIRLV